MLTPCPTCKQLWSPPLGAAWMPCEACSVAFLDESGRGLLDWESSESAAEITSRYFASADCEPDSD